MRLALRAGVIVTATALAGFTSAQLRVPGTPVAATGALSGDVPTISVPVPDVETYRLEDRWNHENNVPGPLRFGVPVPVDIDMQNSGRWDVGPDGELVWRIRIESPGAHSLGLEFSSYRLHEGAQLFVYDDGLTEIYGAFDHTQNNPDGLMAVSPYPGDSIVVEYKQRADVAAVGQVEISHVIYDYVDFFELERELDEREAQLHSGGGGGGVTGGCTVGANCSQFDQYALQKRASVRTVYGGGLCSASLINNTASDGTPYVYTANHCGQGGSTTFRFKYVASGCGSGGAPSTFQMNGAQNLATDTDTDGRLMRINQSIPANYEPYFNGWRRTSANPSFGLSFHFPGGSPMCGMIDSNGGGKITPNFQGIGPVLCWNMNASTGGTQGGSSGSPLFDGQMRTIGTLTGGPPSCFTSYYARFYEFWNDTNINQYLDPSGTGQTTLGGYDPQGTPPSGSLSVDSISPSTLDSVEIDDVIVLINGEGFTDATAVKVDGVELSSGFPSDWQKTSDEVITIVNWPQINHLGAVTVEVETAAESESGTVTLQVPSSPALDVEPSDPDFLFTVVPIVIQVGATPGSVVFNAVSPDNLPTILPGLASLDIGNNFATIFLINSPISGAGGYAESTLSAAGVAPGKTFYFQSAVFDPTIVPGGFPLLSTNVQQVNVLF